ncbi:non-homologous end-joining DNA ligase [Salinisphaera sp. Q1T1-3]|uniref:non-homologous end-joining DNA ligase n=1 Tax=Salinisphaera sp. Q1T1-3 TaxID=2321229 RepID=UPI000E73013A|nr:ATP-dependent DNA ligase [Salinisphaera sp. Q1T1-3]
MPRTFEPMLATLHHEPFSHDDWIFERKLDGIRLMVFRDGDSVELYTRNGKQRNAHFPELVALFAAQPCQRFVLDGEVVAFEGQTPSFVRLQQRAGIADPQAARASGIAVHFYVFDSPWMADHDLRRVPLRQRKQLIHETLEYTDGLRFTPHRNGDGKALLAEARRKGWEGILAKQAQSPYRCGRSKRWLKLKVQTGQELVIGGYTEPQGTREGLGALLVGYYAGDRFCYAGRVGTGFSEAELKRLYSVLAAIERQTSPFDEPPAGDDIHWVTPERVAAIAFTEWTADGKLRHPAYIGERDDKNAADVAREH